MKHFVVILGKNPFHPNFVCKLENQGIIIACVKDKEEVGKFLQSLPDVDPKFTIIAPKQSDQVDEILDIIRKETTFEVCIYIQVPSSLYPNIPNPGDNPERQRKAEIYLLEPLGFTLITRV